LKFLRSPHSKEIPPGATPPNKAHLAALRLLVATSSLQLFRDHFQLPFTLWQLP